MPDPLEAINMGALHREEADDIWPPAEEEVPAPSSQLQHMTPQLQGKGNTTKSPLLLTTPVDSQECQLPSNLRANPGAKDSLALDEKQH